MTSAIDDLLESIFDGMQPELAAEVERWLRASRPFRAFAQRYSSKLRSKLRGIRDEAGLLDLRAELEAAVLLLREERFALDYESYIAARQRGPDFTVTFKTHTRFNVEVRRLRRAEANAGAGEPPTDKLIAILCDKVGQMPPSFVNVLWLAVDGAPAEAEVAQAAATLRRLAETKAEEFFTRRGFESAAAFLRSYGRLSAIVIRQASVGMALWANPLARHTLPPAIATALRRLDLP